MAEKNVIDFDETTYQQKKGFIIKLILKASNFTNPTASTLDWSTSIPELHVPSSMVLSFLISSDFERICSQLVGKKNNSKFFKKMFKIVFFNGEM